MTMSYFNFEIDLNSEQLQQLCGEYDHNVKLLQSFYDTRILIRDNECKVFTADEELFKKIRKHLELLIANIKEDNTILDERFIKETALEATLNFGDNWRKGVAGYTFQGKPIRFRTFNQYCLYKQLEANEIVFAIGPAGTGKTFLAVMAACKALKKGDIRKIVLTRPAVEAGESLGFLPGDLKEKVDPYLMPLYDALYEILGVEQVEKLIEKGVIEIVPLAYLRGRTFANSFVILDEAQNTTDKQMLMFLTRIGENSKMLIGGDITQTDLDLKRNVSGLQAAKKYLHDIEGIAFVEFSSHDVVRHPLVEKIINSFKS